MAAAAHGGVGLACVLRALGSEIERELCVSVGRYRCVFILRLSTVNLGHGEAAQAASCNLHHLNLPTSPRCGISHNCARGK